MTRLENVLDWHESYNKITVEMTYLPTLSVNRYKTVRGITRSEVKKWMDDLSSLLLLTGSGDRLHGKPIKVTLTGVFKDNRHPDMDNLLKVTCDAIKVGLGIDDKEFTHETKPAQIGNPPRLIITIEDVSEII